MAVTEGTKVRVHYKGTLDDGSIFDSSEGSDPIEFVAGAGEVIQGFDQAVLSMNIGEKKQIRLPPPEAYGDRQEDLLEEIEKKLIQDLEVQVGTWVEVKTTAGQMLDGQVTKVNEGSVMLDFNHPLAGKTLNFEIELVGTG